MIFYIPTYFLSMGCIEEVPTEEVDVPLQETRRKMRKSPVGKRKDVIPSGGSNSADKLNGKIIWRKKRTENGKKKENTSRSLPI